MNIQSLNVSSIVFWVPKIDFSSSELAKNNKQRLDAMCKANRPAVIKKYGKKENIFREKNTTGAMTAVIDRNNPRRRVQKINNNQTGRKKGIATRYSIIKSVRI